MQQSGRMVWPRGLPSLEVTLPGAHPERTEPRPAPRSSGSHLSRKRAETSRRGGRRRPAVAPVDPDGVNGGGGRSPGWLARPSFWTLLLALITVVAYVRVFGLDFV